jgi:hypothetical protein
MSLEYELVGMGLTEYKGAEFWCVTYQKAPAQQEGGIPDLHHHVFPPTIFRNYAEEFGLDLDDDEDFDDILEIVLYGPFAGDDDPSDDIDAPTEERGKPERRNETGRKMRRRADRAKVEVSITGLGIEGVRDTFRSERRRGSDSLDARIQRLEARRGRARAVAGRSESGPDGADQPIGVDHWAEDARGRSSADSR